MKKLSQSTVLNLGSLATIIAFPLLYTAVNSGGPVPLWTGFAFMAAGMASPFIAQKFCAEPPDNQQPFTQESEL